MKIKQIIFLLLLVVLLAASCDLQRQDNSSNQIKTNPPTTTDNSLIPVVKPQTQQKTTTTNNQNSTTTAPSTGSICGTVTLIHGARADDFDPIVDNIKIYSADQKLAATATSDSSGKYTVKNLLPGNYIIIEQSYGMQKNLNVSSTSCANGDIIIPTP